MEVRLKSDLKDLELLEGLVVVLDVFRASNTLIALLGAGVEEVLIVADLGLAFALKRAEPERLLLGERGGLPPAGFDGGNSPSQAARLKAAGGKAILTTSAGTRAVGRLERAWAVLFGSFANAAALVEAVRQAGPVKVHLLPMGFEAREPALEDDEAALYLKAALEGRRPDFGPIRARLLGCPGADRLRRLGQADDLEFCTRLDSHKEVPLVVRGQIPRAVRWPGPGSG